ncbi:thioredoxin reductase (NADPH) [Halobacillus karajensis]|uniref:Ferredoxin--NADP reductase n=1 Tax=Halobacillus karajensis TaxID=195088 RepID=A0A024P8X5_9BACI|nr:NAD(P)/FAD-dependent oxidoreductase [Halobacillus karajensis]CDQ21455.1 Ferredoxin--NADP reductase 2 [Halobacillus karajensis]CDQ25390.1 Ferredoxin--NADP reductase 2 [Halobacillus karajensis]CDQ29714.1 Ferredoxin--NADP reductase 2 [Halobacillus karajensis]SEI07829.1 thioredoxin reductase (NADPH) [Halobacillus karajensis]
MDEIYDVTVIGGGTTGLYSAFYSGMRDLKTKVIEYQPQFGGKVSFFYPEKKIYDVGGLPGIRGEDLASNVTEQAASVDTTFVTGVKITSMAKRQDDIFILKTENGEEHFSKTVLIASGLGTFKMQPLSVKGSAQYDGRQIHYTIQHLEQYRGQKVGVISQNRVGIDWALALEAVAEEVHLLNRGDEFKAVYKYDLEKLEASTVNVYKNLTIEELRGADVMKEAVLSNGAVLDIDHLLIYEGLQIDKSMYEEWGLETDKGRIPVGTDMCTSISGVFVAGDAAVYPSKTMLIASGFNEAMTAVNSAAKYLDPKAKSQVYSTVIYKHQ